MFDLTDALGQVAEQPVVVDPADAYTALSYAYAEQTRELERYKAAHLVASEKVAAFQGALTIALSRLEYLIGQRRRALAQALRGALHRVAEGLGVTPALEPDHDLSPQQRQWLKSMGVRTGRHALYMPAMLKPAAARLRIAMAAPAMAPPAAAAPTIICTGAMGIDSGL